jgi:hypothetical protein
VQGAGCELLTLRQRPGRQRQRLLLLCQPLLLRMCRGQLLLQLLPLLLLLGR